MRLEKKREQELARREGFATRTILQFIWLILTSVVAFLAIQWLFANNYLDYNFFYRTFGIPRTVPDWVFVAGLVLIAVIVLQFFFVLGYVVASPAGRERMGRPTPYSKNPDPLQDDYRN